MRTALTIATVVAAVTTGCIYEETSHTLYLEPSGALSWVVLERHVRSDEGTEEKRRAEEDAYLRPVLAGEHPVNRALANLGASRVTTELLRETRPYWVLTEAEFVSAETMAQRLLDELSVTGWARLWSEGERTTFEVVVDLPDEEEVGDVPDDALVLELVDVLESYTIILTRGEFVAAENFTIDGDTAVPVEPDEEQMKAEGQVRFTLTWVAK